MNKTKKKINHVLHHKNYMIVSRSGYYKDLIKNFNHPLKENKTINFCRFCKKTAFETGTLSSNNLLWDYITYQSFYCSDICKVKFSAKFAYDNDIRVLSKRRNGLDVKNDFTLSQRRLIFEHDLLKPNEDLILKAIEKFKIDIRNCDYICTECLRPIEKKYNLLSKKYKDNKSYNRSFGYNVELTHIEHKPKDNSIKFNDDMEIVEKSVKFKCANCHSLETIATKEQRKKLVKNRSKNQNEK